MSDFEVNPVGTAEALKEALDVLQEIRDFSSLSNASAARIDRVLAKARQVSA